MGFGAGQIRAGAAFVEIGAQTTKFFNAMRAVEARVRGLGDNLARAGRGALAAGAVLGAPLAAAVPLFAGFEQGMARVRALTGATGTDFAALTDRARALGASTVYTATQAAQAMSVFALAGRSVNEILTATGPTLDLAAAGQLDIAQAADIGVKIMAGMGIEAGKLGAAFDVLTKAMTTANTDLAQLGDAFRYVGPVAKTAGLSFEETTAAIQLLSNAGIQAEMAGTTLRGGILSLTNPTAEAKKTLDALGVTVADAAGNMRPLADILADFETALEGVGGAQRLATIGKVFDARQAAGFAELIGQGGAALRNATAELRAAAGTSARIAGIQLDTLRGDATILFSQLEGLALAAGEAIVGPLRVIVQYVGQAVTAVTAWVKANRELVAIYAAGVAGVAALGAALIAAGLALKVAAVASMGLLSAVATLGSLGAAAFGVLLTPIGAAVAGLAALAFATGHAQKALGAAAAYIGQAFGRLRDIVRQTMGAITDALMAGDFELATRALWAGVQVAWAEARAELVRLWAGAWREIELTARTIVYAVTDAAINAWFDISTAWAKAAAAIKNTTNQLGADMKSTWLLVTDWVSRQIIKLSTPAELVDAALALADDQLAEDARKIEDRARDNQAAINAKRDAALAEIKAQRELSQAARDNDFAGNQARTIEEAERAVTDAQANAAAARNELARLAAAALANRNRQRYADALARGTLAAKYGRAGAADALAGEAGALADAATADRGGRALGTYSALVARQLAATGPDETLRTQKAIERNTGELVRVTRRNAAAFT